MWALVSAGHAETQDAVLFLAHAVCARMRVSRQPHKTRPRVTTSLQLSCQTLTRMVGTGTRPLTGSIPVMECPSLSICRDICLWLAFAGPCSCLCGSNAALQSCMKAHFPANCYVIHFVAYLQWGSLGAPAFCEDRKATALVK